MLYDPLRHERLQARAWNEDQAHAAIRSIVAHTEAAFRDGRYWPVHPLDREGDDPDPVETPLYHGAAGVIWALHYLRDSGAVILARDYLDEWPELLAANRAWLDANAPGEHASFLMGDTPILMMVLRRQPGHADALARLIAANRTHPARELMWGAPGTLLAALFLYGQTREERWATLFRDSAQALWTQLSWSDEHRCAYWTQELYGRHSTYLDAVHGFVATAAVLVKGRELLDAAVWQEWQACIANTVCRTAVRAGARL